MPATAAVVTVSPFRRSAREPGGDVAELDPAYPFAHEIAVDPVGAVREREAGLGVGPPDMPVRAGVPERTRRVRRAEAAVAQEVLPVVAREHEPERAVH